MRRNRVLASPDWSVEELDMAAPNPRPSDPSGWILDDLVSLGFSRAFVKTYPSTFSLAESDPDATSPTGCLPWPPGCLPGSPEDDPTTSGVVAIQGPPGGLLSATSSSLSATSLSVAEIATDVLAASPSSVFRTLQGRLAALDREVVRVERRTPLDPDAKALFAERDFLVLLGELFQPDTVPTGRGPRGRVDHGRYCVTARGQRMSLDAWSAETGVPVETLRARIAARWNPEDVVRPDLPPWS